MSTQDMASLPLPLRRRVLLPPHRPPQKLLALLPLWAWEVSLAGWQLWQRVFFCR